MPLIRLLVTVFLGLGLSSCALEVPAMAKTERGEIFMGSMRVTLVEGSYMLRSLEGKTVSGTYDPIDVAKSRVFNFTVSDGRQGMVMINRMTSRSGYGIGKLSTGEKCKLMYGDFAVSMDMGADF